MRTDEHVVNVVTTCKQCDSEPAIDGKAYCGGCLVDRLWDKFNAPPTPEELAGRRTFTNSVGEFLPELFINPQYPTGWCPICGKHDGVLAVYRLHFGICTAHKKRWIRWTERSFEWNADEETRWRRNAVDTYDYDGECDGFDWSVFVEAFKQVGIPLPARGTHFFPTWEQQWLLAQTGCWEPPCEMRWVSFDASTPLIGYESRAGQLTREECCQRDRLRHTRDNNGEDAPTPPEDIKAFYDAILDKDDDRNEVTP